MNRVSRAPDADPLYARPAAERPSYATGMLLDAQDFTDEQTYHRGRLPARWLSLPWSGTLLACVPAQPVSADPPPVPRDSRDPGLPSILAG